MVVDDVFWLSGRAGRPVVTGRTHEGQCTVGDALDLVDETGNRRSVVLRGVEMVCRVGQPPADEPPLNLLLGDDLPPDDVRPGLVLEKRE